MFPGFSLANAESTDPTVSNLSTVLVCIGIVLAVVVVALVPVMIARFRKYPRSDAIVAVAVLWGMLASVSAASAELAWMKYSHEHLLLIQSGYYDPTDLTDSPKLPWLTWAGLGVGYGLLLTWALVAKPKPAPADAPREG